MSTRPAKATPTKTAPANEAPEEQEAPEDTLTYEQAVAELADIVHKLESGDVPLSSAMNLWERGEKLAAICTSWLDGAKARIEAAVASDTGEAL